MSVVRTTDKVKVFLTKKRKLLGLSEGEVLELELFGRLSKKR